MILGIFRLSARRKRIRKRMDGHRMAFRQQRRQLTGDLSGYLGTPQSLLHAFLAGFFIDQARAAMPSKGPDPLKLMMPFLLRLI